VDDRIQRASANDVLMLATDVGPVPMQVGAVLVLGPGRPLDLATVQTAIRERSVSLPRLRQRLVRTPFGCGRPVWVDDDGFDITHHVREVAVPTDDALWDVAARLATEQLPDDRPPWSATLLTGPTTQAQALVVVFHHVLADGIGGLAMLANLVDGAVPGEAAPPLRPPPTGALFRDAWRERLRALRHVRAGLAALRAVPAEVRQARALRASACSLLQPTGPDRAFRTTGVPLAPVVDLAHREGATVNDVVLAAVAGALAATLADRGEPVPSELVVSVPVSTRGAADGAALGNSVGVRPVAVPTAGPPLARLASIAAARRQRPETSTGATATLVATLFRLLARVGLFRWFIERQRMVHTFVTNLRGPDVRLRFLGHEVTHVVPLTSVAGNVSVAFAVLSYAGTLGVTVVADPAKVPDHGVLCTHLADELRALADAGAPAGSAA